MSLKGILLYGLNVFLFNKYEEDWKRFIVLSHKQKRPNNSAQSLSSSELIDWSRIPLQKKPIKSSVLYISALPQVIFNKTATTSSHPQRAKTQQLVTQLRQFQSQSSARYLKCEDPAIRFWVAIWQSFEIDSQRSGWISFRLSKRGVVHWIQHLLSADSMLQSHHTLVINQSPSRSQLSSSAWVSPAHNSQPPIRWQPTANTNGFYAASINPFLTPLTPVSSNRSTRPNKPVLAEPGLTGMEPQLWQAQYTHARCCSLINSWVRRCSPESSDSGRLPLVRPTTPTTVDILALKDPPAQQLVQALVDLGDAMFWIPYRYPAKQYPLLLKPANHVCQAFEAFYRQALPGALCGEEGTQDQAQTQDPMPWPGSMSLLFATRNMLKSLLMSTFQEIAPDAL